MSAHRQSTDLFLLAPTWKGRGLAFLRFLAFVILFCVFSFVLLLFFYWLPISQWHFDPTAELEGTLAMQVAAQGLGALAATALMARAGGRRLRDFGLGGHDRLRNFVIGIATGLALLSLMLLTMRVASAFSIELATSAISTAAVHAAFYALLMLGVAFSEESLCRGYALVVLSQSISFWPAAIATGAVFGLLHAVNGGETVVGLASAGLFGIVLAYSYRQTRSLWFACGIHGGWDYAESFVFGVPNSGVTLPGGLFHTRVDGAAWLTGGSAGPEGSVLMLLALGIMLLVVWKIARSAAGANPESASVSAWAATTAPR
jgi:CAAX protease family protein